MAANDEWEDVASGSDNEWEDITPAVAPQAPQRKPIFYNTKLGKAVFQDGMFIGDAFMARPDQVPDAAPVFSTPNAIPAGTPDLKVPEVPVGRTGNPLGDLFSSFMEHFSANQHDAATNESAGLSAVRGLTGSTPILDQRRVDEIRQFNDMTPWQKEPTLGEGMAGFAGAAGGTLVGGLQDPTSLIGGGGKTALNTFLRNAGMSGLSDSIAQIFTGGLPTEYNAQSEQYNPNTQEFDQNGPNYVAPGFSPTRVGVNALTGGLLPHVLETGLGGDQGLGALAKEVQDAILGGYNKLRSGRANPNIEMTDMGAMPKSPQDDLKAALATPEVMAVLKANNIAPDDPRLAELVPKIEKSLKSNAAQRNDFNAGSPLETPSDAKSAKADVEAAVGQRRALNEANTTGIDPATGEKFNSGMDPRTGTEANRAPGVIAMGQSRQTPAGGNVTIKQGEPLSALTQTGRSAAVGAQTYGKNATLTRDEKIALLDRFGYVPDGIEQQRTMLDKITGEKPTESLDAITTDVPGTKGSPRALGEPATNDPGVQASVAKQREDGAYDLSPGQVEELRAAWGVVPETVATRRAAYDALQREKARNAGPQDVFRTSDAALSREGPAPEGVTVETGNPRYDPASQPLDRGIAPDSTGSYERTGKGTDISDRAPEVPRGTQTASGNSDRPFKADETPADAEMKAMEDQLNQMGADERATYNNYWLHREEEKRLRPEYERARDAYVADTRSNRKKAQYEKAFNALKAAGDRASAVHTKFLTTDISNQFKRFGMRAKSEEARARLAEHEAAARERADNIRRETIEDLERFWKQQRDERARDSGAREKYNQRQEKARQKYEGTASSNKEKGLDPEGRFHVDENGFVLSDKGGPITFADQKQTAKWILKAQKESLDQNFEIHNHPTKANSFTARETSRTSKADARGNAGNDAGAGARADAGPDQGTRTEQPGNSARQDTQGTGGADTSARDGAAGESRPAGDNAQIPYVKPEPGPKQKAHDDLKAQLDAKMKERKAQNAEVNALHAEHQKATKANDAEKLADIKKRAEAMAPAHEKTVAEIKDIETKVKYAKTAADAEAKAGQPKKDKSGVVQPEQSKTYDGDAPKFESMYGFDKRPAGPEDLNPDGTVKGTGNPDFKGEQKPPKGGVKFHSNPFADPEVLIPLVKGAVRDIKALVGKVAQLKHSLRDSTTIGHAIGAFEDGIFRTAFYTTRGFMQTFVDRYKGLKNHEASRLIKDMMNWVADDPGRGEAIGTTLHEAIIQQIGLHMNRVANILDGLPDTEEAHRALSDAMQFPGKATSPDMAKRAERLRALLEEFRGNINKALQDITNKRVAAAKTLEEKAAAKEEGRQLQVGFVENFFPRILDEEKLAAPGAYDEFIAAAMKEYRRQLGYDAKTAKEAAEKYWRHATGIEHTSFKSTASKADTLESRVFQARSDSGLNKFYIDNPYEALHHYFMNTVRSVETMKRFGVNHEIFDANMTRLGELGVSSTDRAQIASLLETATGKKWLTMGTTTDAALNYARLYSSYRFLDQSVFASLFEPVAIAARTGHLPDAWNGMIGTAKQILNSGDAEETRAFAEALGIVEDVTNEVMLANKFTGAGYGSRFQRRMSSRLFRSIYLSLITKAQRETASRLAHNFMFRQIGNYMRGKSKESARFLLAEAGLSEDMIPKIAKMIPTDGSLPKLGDILGDSPEAEAYRTAVGRVVNHSIQNPSGIDKPMWASSPLGSLVFGIASFQSSFTRNLLYRQAKLFGSTVSGVAQGKLGMRDVVNMAAGPAFGLGTLLMVQGLARLEREKIFNPEQYQQKPNDQKAMLAFSGSGAFGNLDRPINSWFGLKYHQDMMNSLAGPLITTTIRDLQNELVARADPAHGNSPNNNTAEWKGAKSTYDMLAPFATMALATAADKVPGIIPKLAIGAYMLSPIAPGAPGMGAAYADSTVGERDNPMFKYNAGPQGEGDNPFSGGGSEPFTQNMPSLISSANAAEVPAPTATKRKRKYVISRDADGNIIAGNGRSVYSIKKDKSGRVSVEEQ